MDREKRKEWLASLKAGGMVAVQPGRSTQVWFIHKIEQITDAKKKRFLVNGVWFDETGYREIDRWNSDLMEPVTPEIIEHARRRRAITRIKKIKWDDLDTDTLQAIVTLLEPKLKKKPEEPTNA